MKSITVLSVEMVIPRNLWWPSKCYEWKSNVDKSINIIKKLLVKVFHFWKLCQVSVLTVVTIVEFITILYERLSTHWGLRFVRSYCNRCFTVYREFQWECYFSRQFFCTFGCSVNISQNLQEKTCAKVSFLIKLEAESCNFIKKGSGTGIFLGILRNF